MVIIVCTRIDETFLLTGSIAKIPTDVRGVIGIRAVGKTLAVATKGSITSYEHTSHLVATNIRVTLANLLSRHRIVYGLGHAFVLTRAESNDVIATIQELLERIEIELIRVLLEIDDIGKGCVRLASV